MSSSFYDKRWFEAQVDLGAIIIKEKKLLEENAPPKVDREGVFQTLANFYIKKLDECYDQILHPQKRLLLRQVLDGTMGRMLELRQELVNLECSDYSYFDDIITSQKLTPHDMEIPIPKYFIIERMKAIAERERLLGLILAKLNLGPEPEVVDKRSESLNEQDDNLPTLEEAIKLIQRHERARQGRMKAKFMQELRKQEDLKHSVTRYQSVSTMDEGTAALIIQKMWRGTLQREKYNFVKDQEMIFLGMELPPVENPKLMPEATNLRYKEERRKMQEANELEYHLAVQQITNKVREQEGPDMKETLMEQIRQWFIECRNVLGRFPNFPSEQEGGSEKIFKDKDPVEVYKELEQAELEKSKKDKKGDSKDKKKGKKDDKKDKKSKGKKSPEGDDYDNDRKEKKFKLRKTGNDDDDDKGEEGWRMSKSNFVDPLADASIQYNEVWNRRDESWNFSQKYDPEIIRGEKRIEVENEIRIQVDELMRQELKNLKLAIDKDKGKKAGKGRKGKKGKTKKDKKKKKMKDLTPDSTLLASVSTPLNRSGASRQAASADYLDGSNQDDLETWMSRKPSTETCAVTPASNEPQTYHITHLVTQPPTKGKKRDKDLTGHRTIESLYEELVCEGIIKQPEKVHLKDFEGEYCYIGSLMKVNKQEPPPPLGDIRRIITEYAILPLGSPAVHENSPLTRSVLLTGPAGSGKKMLVHAICTETGANLIDLTATNIAGKYPGKDGLKLLLHMVFKVGNALQPTVIHVGECEKMFKKKIPKTDTSDPKRLKKQLPKILKFIYGEDRILLVGTTRLPFDGEVRPMTSLYQKIVYIPRPDYQSRRLLWRSLIKRQGGSIKQSLDLSSLSKISDGYTAGAIESVCKSVLTEARIKSIMRIPLKAKEFIPHLAKIDPVYKEEEEAFKVWLAKTPMGKKRAKLLESLNEEVSDKKGKKSAGKKGKK